jgi:Rrf2 family protein
MKITALEEYGFRCMLLLARSGQNVSMTLPAFARSEGLSVPYAGKLLMILKKAGLVMASRGRNGGYLLTKMPEDIRLKEIFDALGDPVYSPAHCDRFTGENDTCVHDDDCTVRHIWKSFDGFIGNMLSRVSLADIAAGDIDLSKAMEAPVLQNRTQNET